MLPVDLVTIGKYAADNGCDANAVRAKIINLAWREGENWVIAPDGDILVSQSAKLGAGRKALEFKGSMYLRRTAIPITSMPTGSGIYFLMLGESVRYIGQATGLMRRIGQHMFEQRIAFDRVSWIPCDRGQLNRMERAYIILFQPAENQRGVDQ